MLLVYPRITKELRACYKVYAGKQITVTFYFFSTWPVKGKQNNTVKFGVPEFFGCAGVPVFRCSGVPGCSGVHDFSTCHPVSLLVSFTTLALTWHSYAD